MNVLILNTYMSEDNRDLWRLPKILTEDINMNGGASEVKRILDMIYYRDCHEDCESHCHGYDNEKCHQHTSAWSESSCTCTCELCSKKEDCESGEYLHRDVEDVAQLLYQLDNMNVYGDDNMMYTIYHITSLSRYNDILHEEGSVV